MLSVHLDVLCYAFDPIKVISASDLPSDEQQQRPSSGRFNYHFLPPLFLISLIYVDTLCVFYSENFQLQYHAELFTSKILPKDFWRYGGTLVYIGITMQLTIYLNLFTRSKQFLLATDKRAENRYGIVVLTIQVDSLSHSVKLLNLNDDDDRQKSCINKALLRDLLHLRAKAYRLMTALYSSSVLQFEVFHLWQFISHWTVSSSSTFQYLRNFLYLLLLPPLLLYTAYANVLLICYFILTASYILRRQSSHLCKLQTLIGRLATEVQRWRKKQATLPQEELELRCRLLWWRFNRLNGGDHLLRLFTEINALNSFWSPLLTLVYAFHIILICYMAFTHHFVASQLEWYHRTFFFFFGIILSSTLLAVTAECSAIVQNNVKTFKLNNLFCFTFSTLTISTLSLPDLIKVDRYRQNYRSHSRIGFRLLNECQVQSSTFELIFYYISTVFMLIIRNHYFNWREKIQ